MQRMTRELAILGGSPAFADPLHVGRPNLPDRGTIEKYFGEILDRVWLTNDGPFVRSFEDALREVTGAAECVAVCNATIGLQLLQRAIALSGNVIVPSFTFVATPHSLQWQGISPRFGDIDPETHQLRPASAEHRIDAETSALMPVHLWGDAVDTDEFESMSRRHGLPLIFDAAHGLGVVRNGRRVGTFGLAEVFSFHATKLVNSFEGGAISTNDASLAEELRHMRNFGFAGYDTVACLGTNAKMSEPSAAMGLASLAELDATIAHNRTIFAAYQQAFKEMDGLRLRMSSASVESNCQYVVTLVEPSSGLRRDELVTALHAEGVLARRYFYPGCHQMEPYRTLMPDERAHLVVTEQIADAVLVLPTGRSMSAAIAGRVAEVIAELNENAPAVRAALQGVAG